MELVTVLGVLAQRRLLVALGLLGATIVGLAATGAISLGPLGSTERHSTTAYSRIQIDTPKSLLVDLQTSSATIATQTVLLADQLAQGTAQRAIARIAGIAPRRLSVLSSDAAFPVRVSPLATRATEIAATPYTPYVMTVSASAQLPVISIAVSGPDSAVVGHLAQAPRSVLQSITTAGARTPKHRLSVKSLTPVVFDDEVVTGGSKPLIGLIAFLALAALWCGCLVIAAGVARAWRGAGHGDAPSVRA